MSRPRRYAPAGEIFHVVNRGNDKRAIFSEPAHYECFITLLDETRAHAAVTIVGYCLMGTHFHLLLRPKTDDALSAYMHRVQGCYACYLRKQTNTVGWGHVFQHRFWAKRTRGPLHLLTTFAYVEGNPVAANLVSRAEDWPWGSLHDRVVGSRRLVDLDAIRLPTDWALCVNLPRQRRFQELTSRLMWYPRHHR